MKWTENERNSTFPYTAVIAYQFIRMHHRSGSEHSVHDTWVYSVETGESEASADISLFILFLERAPSTCMIDGLFLSRLATELKSPGIRRILHPASSIPSSMKHLFYRIAPSHLLFFCLGYMLVLSTVVAPITPSKLSTFLLYCLKDLSNWKMSRKWY